MRRRRIDKTACGFLRVDFKVRGSRAIHDESIE